jgi:hypothetical protein
MTVRPLGDPHRCEVIRDGTAVQLILHGRDSYEAILLYEQIIQALREGRLDLALDARITSE